MDKIVGVAKCEEKAWISEAYENWAIRIDVGMLKWCGDGFPEVFEISENSRLKVLTSNPLYRDKYLHRERKGGLGLLILEQGPKQVEVKAYEFGVHLVELQGTGELYAMKAMEKSMMLNRNKVVVGSV